MEKTSNGRFAVDREFVYRELVSQRDLGEVFGPPGGLFGSPRGPLGPEGPFGPLGGVSENFFSFSENACVNF